MIPMPLLRENIDGAPLESSSIKAYLMRHGESEANRLNLTGLDLPLTDKGRRQARETPLPDGITTVVSSTLCRARETADIVASRLGLTVAAEMPEFNELSFGRYEGREVDEWLNGMYLNDLSGLFEQVGDDDAEARARQALSALRQLPDGTLVVTSATLLRCMVGVTLTGRVASLSELPSMGNCFVLEYDAATDSFSWD